MASPYSLNAKPLITSYKGTGLDLTPGFDLPSLPWNRNNAQQQASKWDAQAAVTTPSAGIYWVGQDNNVYLKSPTGVKNMGTAISANPTGFDAQLGSASAAQIRDPNPGNAVVAGANTGIYSGGETGDPNTDPGAIANLRSNISGLMDLFHNAFQGVVNRVDTMAAQKKADIIKNYTEQGQNLQTNYGNTAQSINNVLYGQGAGNSSYNAVQQGAAKDAYDQATRQMNEAQTGDLASVGQYADTTKAQLAASNPNYDVNNYNTVSDLQTISDAVNQALGQLRVSNAGMGTQGEYVSHLNAITPRQEQGSGQLRAQLTKLSGVNAPPDAKRAIAETIINNASTGDGNDQAWLSWFDELMAQTGSGATTEPLVSPVA